jgi:hypothetical protein
MSYASDKYFPGHEDVTPRTAAQARALIGTRVLYLRNADVDKSGRGYLFPQSGTVAEVRGREVAIDEPGNFVIHLGNLVIMVKAPPKQPRN